MVCFLSRAVVGDGWWPRERSGGPRGLDLVSGSLGTVYGSV